MPFPKTCAFCNKSFIAERSAAKYCCRDCGWQAKYLRQEKECLICHRSFYPRPADRKYCSQECYHVSRIGKPSIQPGEHPVLICETCGKPFEVYPSRLKFGNPRFCSDECFYKWLNGSERAPRIEVNCLTCGKPIHILKSKYEQGERGRYCSQKCMIAVRPKPPRMERIECTCLNCGKSFYKLQCQIGDNRGRFCCRGCVGAYVMKNIRANGPTSIEQVIKKSLDSLGLEYEPQYTGISPWVIDFAFPAYKLAIEVDGKYWHSLENVKEKDKRKNKALRKLGWGVLHFGEDEVNQSPSACLDRIIQFLDSHVQLHLF